MYKLFTQIIKIKDEEGASLAEYGLLLGIITIGILAAINALGCKVTGAITNATDAFNSF